jgi:hypothetical protein
MLVLGVRMNAKSPSELLPHTFNSPNELTALQFVCWKQKRTRLIDISERSQESMSGVICSIRWRVLSFPHSMRAPGLVVVCIQHGHVGIYMVNQHALRPNTSIAMKVGSSSLARLLQPLWLSREASIGSVRAC